MSKVYRNIYFLNSIFKEGKGHTNVLYYGSMYSYAKSIKDFLKNFDRTLDLLIQCDKCGKNKYGKFIKVKRP